MNIQNRKKKPYSSKLFNELFLYALLINSENQAYLYILEKEISASRRTLYRYADDLHKNGIIPELSLKKTDKYKYFSIDEIDSDTDEDSIIEFLNDYMKKHKKLFGKSKQRKEKIFRICSLITLNIGRFYNIHYFEEKPKKYDCPIKVNGDTFAFENFDNFSKLYKNLSMRTSQREIKIAKEVITKLF